MNEICDRLIFLIYIPEYNYENQSVKVIEYEIFQLYGFLNFLGWDEERFFVIILSCLQMGTITSINNFKIIS